MLLVAHICSGNFSRVFLAFRKSDRKEVAIKCIDKRRFWGLPKTKEQLLREAAILREVQHPNIIAVHEVVDSAKFLYLVLELYAALLLFSAEAPFNRAVYAVLQAASYLT